MGTDVRIPAIGDALDDVYLVEWRVSDGAMVEEGQDLFSIESDKSAIDVVAPVSGRIAILAGSATMYAPGHVVASIG